MDNIKKLLQSSVEEDNKLGLILFHGKIKDSKYLLRKKDRDFKISGNPIPTMFAIVSPNYILYLGWRSIKLLTPEYDNYLKCRTNIKYNYLKNGIMYVE